MKYFDHYHLPTTVDGALDLLAAYDGRARVIAGGTDLLLDLQAEYFEGQRPHYAALIDVTRIAGANEIRADGDFIVIGCGVTHAQVVESALIQTRATALAEACSVVGGPQVRNVATLVGNVAHALPAADGTLALMALGAEAQVAKMPKVPNEQPEIINHKSEIHWLPLAALFKGPGESAVDATRELIVAVRFRQAGAGEASAFARVMRPQGVALPILGMVVQVKVRNSEFGMRVEEIAISTGPVAPVPFRAVKTEAFLRGQMFSDETLARAARVLLDEASPRTSPHRATREYRVELLPMLLERTLRAAVERASEQASHKSQV